LGERESRDSRRERELGKRLDEGEKREDVILLLE
jgi:hypothetical protein